jgi:uncharacterized damage-inducible protein DinB
MMKAYFERVFAHRGWANRRTLASILDCPAAHAEATPIMAHLLAAEHVWLSRLRGETPSLPVWPTLTLEQCQSLAAEHDDAWGAYLAGLGDGDGALDAEVTYQDSRGTAFRNTVAELLTQVFTHGPYHRGQIARIVKRAGGTPAWTDFIVWVREGEPGALD